MFIPCRPHILLPAAAAAGINFDFTTGSMPGAITFTRASSGSYFNNSNVLQPFGAGTDVARFDYMAAGATPTLLYEPAATNIHLQSNTFTSGTWTKGGGTTVTGSAATSPDGTSNASNLHTDVSQYGHTEVSLTLSAVSYTHSCWIKANGATGAVILVQAAAVYGSNLTATGSWVRKTYTHTATAQTSGAGIGYNTASAVDTYIYGYQTETTSVVAGGASSYIPTTTASVTRAADSAAFTIPAGVGHLTVTFDDNSTQSITVSPGAYTLTTTLNRPNIKTIVGVA